ncbi:hypothetical protein JTB14_000460 [Gonioctena quinquepunctata]|nr:hypothetical protein JTB14_000460 [Gonioctena quinquepunctata]
MDRFLKPNKFETDSHPPTATQEWKYKLKIFENLRASFKDPDDACKLRYPISHDSHNVHPLIAESDDHSTAIGILKAIFVKLTNEIFARRKQVTRKQESEESIDQYNQALQLFSKNCEFADAVAETHRITCVHDAFIRGINSD